MGRKQGGALPEGLVCGREACGGLLRGLGPLLSVPAAWPSPPDLDCIPACLPRPLSRLLLYVSCPLCSHPPPVEAPGTIQKVQCLLSLSLLASRCKAALQGAGPPDPPGVWSRTARASSLQGGWRSKRPSQSRAGRFTACPGPTQGTRCREQACPGLQQAQL